ncbi:MAG: hypothetical protein AB2559_20490 [Candidatus Thiodiazotropha endolucinida]
MRISKTRLLNLKKRIRAKKVLDEKHIELRRRMEAAQARVDERIQGKLAPEDFDQYLVDREAYYTACHEKWIELRSSMPCRTIAEKFKVADKAAEWARLQTGFNRPIV